MRDDQDTGRRLSCPWMDTEEAQVRISASVVSTVLLVT